MEIVIVTGLSGAGKSQGINCMEDLGYYCIDNMPPALIRNFVELALERNNKIDKAAFVVDVRGGEMLDDAKETIGELKRENIECRIVYLEASDQVLMTRYNETRRAHPIGGESSVQKGIEEERHKLEALRSMADYVIDTSFMQPKDLSKKIKEIFSSGEKSGTFVINLFSFGYKHGLPLGADMIFDMRFIPNPYYIPELKKLTGRNKKVKNYVMGQKVTGEFISMAVEMIHKLIPAYINERKYHLNIGVGCTGGQHRSVVVAEELAEIFRNEGDIVTIEHKDCK